MDVERTEQAARGVRFSVSAGGREVARAYLYIMHNDLHTAPFGLLEDVHVERSERGKGLGTELVKEVIRAAQDSGCYKLIATSRTSRPKVHALYQRLGFEDHGLEFRMNFDGRGVPIVAIEHVQLAMPPGMEQAAREFYQGILGIPEIQKPSHLAKRGGAWFEQTAHELCIRKARASLLGG